MYRNPLQTSVDGKLRATNLVTMPKLLEPPLSARQSPGLVDSDAVAMGPFARTIS